MKKWMKRDQSLLLKNNFFKQVNSWDQLTKRTIIIAHLFCLRSFQIISDSDRPIYGGLGINFRQINGWIFDELMDESIDEFLTNYLMDLWQIDWLICNGSTQLFGKSLFSKYNSFKRHFQELVIIQEWNWENEDGFIEKPVFISSFHIMILLKSFCFILVFVLAQLNLLTSS